MSDQPTPRLSRLLRTVIGDVQWRAPAWLVWANARRRRLLNVGILTALTLAAVAFGWRWYENHPRPPQTRFSIAPPDVTCYGCTPPGAPNSLFVRFSASAAPLALTGKDLGPGPDSPRMTPSLKGRWHWDDDRTLRFQPAEDWPVGIQAHVVFPRGAVTAPHIQLASRQFDFPTPSFTARILETQFHQDPVVAADKKVVVTVTFTHPVNPAELEKRVSLRMFERVTDTREEDRGAVPFTVVYDRFRVNAYIHSALLPVQSKPGHLRVRIESGVRAERGGNETPARLESSTEIPSLYSLHADSIELSVARNERDEPAQVLVVSMNHPVAERDMPRSVHAWLLPLKHPDPAVQAEFEKLERGAFRWTEQSLRRDILSISQPLELTHLPGELDYYPSHAFRHTAEPGSYLYVKVDRGLKSFGGYILADTEDRILQVPPYPGELRITQQGSLLSLHGGRSVTVMTRGVTAVCVEIGRLLPRQIQHLVSQTEGSFSVPTFKSWDFDEADITERFKASYRIAVSKPGAAHYQQISLDRYLGPEGTQPRGVFFVSARSCPADEKADASSNASGWNDRVQQPLSDGRLIVLTDLGMLVKQSQDGSQDVFVQSIHTGGPLQNVRVEILGRNGLPILTSTTDAEGHLRFPDLRSFKHEQQPVVYIGRLGSDTSFLPVEQRDRRLDLSRFDVGGVDNRIDRDSLSAYLFSDRGLYRPGEEIRLGAIVRSQDWTQSTQGVPLRLDVTDPRGVRIRSEPFIPGPAGFTEIRHLTRPSSPAGSYTVSISLLHPREGRDLIGSTVVQVRDFLPDRLKMSTHLSSEAADGWVSPDGLSARVDLENLFGTPAAQRRVTARMVLTPAFPEFRNFPEYHFHDPQAAHQSFEENLAPALTSDSGSATFELNLQRFARATYRLRISTEGFEADGGRGVSSERQQLVSNLPYLIGWKADGDLSYVSRDSKRAVRLVAVGPSTRPITVKKLRIAHLEIRYVSALVRQANGTYQFVSRRKESVIEEHESDLSESGGELLLVTATPGSFAYSICDGSGLQLARIDYRVAGNANLTRTLEKDAQLQITLARNDFAAGDEIEMQVQAPYAGSGLITIERDKVYAWRWFHSSTTTSTQTIRLPEGIEGNAYVHVAFVRDPSSEEIYASPLSYGVQPFSISLSSRRNPVSLEAAPLVKPGTPLELKYSTQRPARIAIFAVDEGILQVARYRTPDPLGHFFQKRALSVTTAQILDLILPEFRGNDGQAAPGGDQDSSLGRHLNPFARKGDKPVAYWSGIMDSDRVARTVTYDIPDFFNGTLRVFAVAVSDGAVGVFETQTVVRADFVLSPNAPLTATPGDEFEVGLGVANNLVGSGPSARLAVRIESGDSFQVLGSAAQTLDLPEGHESVARFRVRTLDRPGPAQLRFTAQSAGTQASRQIGLSIRPATPFMTTLRAGTLKQGSRDVPVDRNLYPEHRKLEASISLVPLSLARGLVTYLGNYPYSCTEQLVSQAMPAMLLAERPEFGYVRSQPGADIAGLINELRVRQNDAGAYRLWPGGSHVEEFVSLYAQHFLIEAAERGERVPAGLIESGDTYVRSIAVRDGNNLAAERDTAYAIYLMTRQGVVMSAEAAALRKRLAARYKDEWRQDMAAAWLAAAFRLMRQENDARQAIEGVRFGADRVEAQSIYDDAMTRDGFLLFVLSRHFPERLVQLKPDVLETVAARISEERYHTLSAGSTLLGLDAFVRATRADDPSAARLAVYEVSRDKSVRPLPLPAGVMPATDFSASARAVRFESASEQNAFFLLEQSGFDRTPPSQAIAKGFEVLRELTDDAGHPLTRVPIGGEVTVHLKFRALADQRIDEVALVDLLPGGFDLVIPREGSNVAGAEYGGGNCQFCVGHSDNLTFADPREDRVVFYVYINRDIQELAYRIKATNVGNYTIPPAYGEAMYDRSAVARSAAGRMEIVRP